MIQPMCSQLVVAGKPSVRVAGLIVLACLAACSTTYKDKSPQGDGAVDATVRPDGSSADAPGSCITGGTSVRTKAPGQACGCSDECQTGFCVEGVCCDAACGDTCRSCNVPGRVGTCSPVPAGMPPAPGATCAVQDPSTCGMDGLCDGAGQCRKRPEGSSCGGGRCEGGTVVEGKICIAGACQPSGKTVVCAPFACDAAKGACSDACAVPGATCGKKDIGMSCAAATDCKSNFCVDGLCCNTACTDGCMQCNLPAKPGQCSPTPKGTVDPRGVCKDAGAAGCGTSGRCTGAGSCAKYDAGTKCLPPSCSGTMLNPSSACDGNGTCVAGTGVDCDPYVCQGDACLTRCTIDGDCRPGLTCNNGVCGNGLLALGRACVTNGQCASMHCADGVCCNEACAGKCRFCAGTGAPGRCVNVPATMPDPRAARGETDPTKACLDQGAPSCGTNGLCNGAAGCSLYSAGRVCKPDSCDTETNLASPAWTCDGSGRCMSSPAQTCAPFTCNGSECGVACQSNMQCSTGNVCAANSCGTKPVGALCSNSGECSSGQCAQGVCCGSACAGSCFSCALPGKQGVCAAVPAGGQDPAGSCRDQGAASCGNDGTCNGSGGCRVYSADAVCTQPTCANGQMTTTGTCNGIGTCAPGQVRLCAPYVCNEAGTGCFESCTLDSQCSAGNPCLNGRCGKKPLGATCSATSDCISGFCADGVCCDGACTGLCQSCGLSGKLGTCSNVPAGVADANAGCTATDPSTCGNDGMCNGAGGCRNWPATTVCRAASCPAGSNTLTRSAFCDGTGAACPAGATASCGSFLCDGVRNACKSTCTTGTRAQDCFMDAVCAATAGGASICGAPKPNGQTCVSAAECVSGQCVDGTCCSTASCGMCQSCASGSCAPVAAGVPDARCAPATGDVCKTNGVCGAAGQCAATPSGTGCGSTCTADGKQQNSTCNGAGVCAVSGTPESCGAYLCKNNACVKKCTSDADCVPGKQCKGGSGQCK